MTGKHTNTVKEAAKNVERRPPRENVHPDHTRAGRWFTLRLVMGYYSIILMTLIIVVACYILVHSSQFPTGVVVAACGALFVDLVGLLVTVWKMVFKTPK